MSPLFSLVIAFFTHLVKSTALPVSFVCRRKCKLAIFVRLFFPRKIAGSPSQTFHDNPIHLSPLCYTLLSSSRSPYRKVFLHKFSRVKNPPSQRCRSGAPTNAGIEFFRLYDCSLFSMSNAPVFLSTRKVKDVPPTLPSRFPFKTFGGRYLPRGPLVFFPPRTSSSTPRLRGEPSRGKRIPFPPPGVLRFFFRDVESYYTFSLFPSWPN